MPGVTGARAGAAPEVFPYSAHDHIGVSLNMQNDRHPERVTVALLLSGTGSPLYFVIFSFFACSQRASLQIQSPVKEKPCDCAEDDDQDQ